MAARPDLGQILGEGHAAIDHHRGARRGGRSAASRRRQHVVHGGPVLRDCRRRLRAPWGTRRGPGPGPIDDLLAVRPVIARVAALGLRIVRALAFEVRRRQVVEVDRVVQVEQRALARGQRLLDRRPLRMQPVEIAIQRLVAERGEVRAQDVGQGRAPDPVRHGVLGGRTHQPVQRHHLGEHARPRREPAPRPGSCPA